MTIPDTTILPIRRGELDKQDLSGYVEELTKTLEHNFEVLSRATTGTLRNDALSGAEAWVPTVSGTSAAGSGTYNHQVGWVLRRGIFVDIWYDVSWSAHTGTGNLYLDLPYLVALSSQKPFVGPIQTSNLTYTGTDCHLNAIPNTRRGEVWTSGSAAATANVAMDTSAQIMGHLSYVGQQEERA